MTGCYLCLIILSLWHSVVSQQGDHDHDHVIPKIPDRFSARMETINSTGQRVTEYRVLMDYEGKFARTDVVPQYGPYRVRNLTQYGNRPLIIINDFNTGHEFVIDRYRGNCSISNISLHSRIAKLDDHHMITGMKHVYEILQGQNMTYNGSTTIRDLPVDVYTRKSKHFEVKLYFLRNSWSMLTEYDEHPAEGVPVGINFTRYNNKTDTWISHMTHVYDFIKDHTEFAEYPMTDCFEKFQTYQLRLHGNPGGDRFIGLDVKFAVQTALAKAMGIAYIRVTIVNYLIPADKRYQYVYVVFRIYEPIRKRGNLVKPVEELSVSRSIANLRQAINRGLFVTLPNFGQKERIKVMASSLKPMESSRFNTDTDTSQSGVVAGVGVALLVVGLAIGFVTAFVLRKRFPCDREVPYEVTN